jgi:WD40 repeat protein
MDFTDLYKQNDVSVSPTGQFIAIVVLHRVIIRDTISLSIKHVFTAADNISYIKWSPDSDLILAVSKSKVFIWRLSSEWDASIDLAFDGNVVFWAGNRHVITLNSLAVLLDLFRI